MKKIKLYGELGDTFKHEWELDVKSPAEAIRAIEANRPGFIAACDAGDYLVIMYHDSDENLIRQITRENAVYPWADETLCVVPRVGGSFGVDAVVAIFAAIGVTLAADGIAALAITLVINIAISIAFSAIANVLTSKKTSVNPGDTEAYNAKPSFISNGAVNVVRQGHPYPVPVGRFLCGTIVLSSNIIVEDIA